MSKIACYKCGKEVDEEDACFSTLDNCQVDVLCEECMVELWEIKEVWLNGHHPNIPDEIKDILSGWFQVLHDTRHDRRAPGKRRNRWGWGRK